MTANATDAVKVVYVARRKYDQDPQSFVRRWREHGALAMAQHRWRNVRRYIHCDVAGELESGGNVAGSVYGGFGMSWYRSPQHRADHVADVAARALMIADERDAFAELISSPCVELILKSIGSAPVLKIVRLVTRVPRVSDLDFSEWIGATAAAARDMPEVTRHVRNVIPKSVELSEPLCCDFLEEFGVESQAALERLVAAPDIRFGGENALAFVRTFITNEIVLFDIDHGNGGPND